MKKLLLVASLLALSVPVHAEDRGDTLYKAYCTQCHGVEGNGKGVNAAHMSVQPRDHTDTKEMSARTDDELFKVIQQGGPSINKSVLMPVWGRNFSDDDIHALVAHLRKLCCQKN